MRIAAWFPEMMGRSIALSWLFDAKGYHDDA